MITQDRDTSLNINTFEYHYLFPASSSLFGGGDGAVGEEKKMLLMKNRWFAALPTSLRYAWKDNLSMIELKRGDKLPLGKEGGFVFFPINSVATLSGRSGDGPRNFIRFSGPNFLIGLADLLGSGDIRYEAEVSGTGYAFALPVTMMLNAIPRGAARATLQVRSISQIAEKAFFDTRCFGAHNGTQRLARVLLEAADAFGDDRPITLTQQELSELLFLRRETISQLVGEWSALNIVSLRRGSIAIQNRDGLLAQSCDCYSSIKDLERAELATWSEIPWVIPRIPEYA